MGLFFIYIIKSALCLAILYLPYTLLLRNERLHALNRVILLSILTLSLAIPLIPERWFNKNAIPIQTTQSENTYTTFIHQVKGTEIIIQGNQSEKKSETAPWPILLMYFYLCGLIGLSLIRLWQFVKMNVFISRGCLWKERRNDGVTLYCHASAINAFSWMHSVVISETDFESPAGKAIYTHEKAHVLYRHSYDTLLLIMVQTLQWFNPFVWMMETDLRNIHEYQADSYVIGHGITPKDYQLYLIKKAVGSKLQSFANGLNQSTLKKRIAMMCNKKTNKWAALKYMYLLPVGAIATITFARPETTSRTDGQFEQLSAVKVTNFQEEAKASPTEKQLKIALENEQNRNYETDLLNDVVTQKATTRQMADISKPIAQDEKVYDKPEVDPEFEGGSVKLFEFIAKNIKYPQSAVDSAFQGRCYCNFIVEKDGSLSNIKVIRHALNNKPFNSPGMQKVKDDIEKEVIRVLSLMPKWVPGKVKGKTVRCNYALPVTFRLQ